MKEKKQNLLSNIPQVNQTLHHSKLQPFLEKFSHDLVLAAVQEETEKVRRAILDKQAVPETEQGMEKEIVENTMENIRLKIAPSLQKAINGTGVILHTGLGRAPLTREAQENLAKIAEGYCTLEFDLESGKRGHRSSHVEELLCQLTGAEAACVVNNNAAAVFLALNTLSAGKEAIISRGQLIEIGGSFRIPEVMEKSGAKMIEIGTTNKTHLLDYARAISDDAGVICVVHTSNFRVKGFVSEVNLAELVELGKKHNVPVMHDLGGGVLIDLQQFGLPYEPVARESVEAGIDVTTFSGDKVLGGPQCGIIVGKSQNIEKIKSNPLMRILRCDKLIYAALEPTLRLYLQEKELLKENQVFKMLLEPVNNLEKRAESLVAEFSTVAKSRGKIAAIDTKVQIGSGALPLEDIPSKAICMKSDEIKTEVLAKKFRMYDPPIIGYIRNDCLLFDLRTILAREDRILLSAIGKILFY